MGPPETGAMTDTTLKRIRRFDRLIQHFNVESLAACFPALEGTKAVGIDGIG